MRNPPVLPLMVTIAVVSVSTAAILIKLCHDAPPVVIAAARLGISTLVLGPVWALRRSRRPASIQRRHVGYLLLAGVLLAAHFFFWITSLKHTSVLSSVVIVTTNPIFVGIASWFLFGERLHRGLIAAIVVAGLGGALIVASDAGEAGSLYGDGMALLGALAASCYFLIGRHVRREVDTLSYITPVYAAAAVTLVALMWATDGGFTGYRSTTYVYFVLLAIVPQIMGHGSINWSLRYLSATTLSIFILGEPVGATVLAWFILDESVTAMQVAGGGLILAGIVVAARTQPGPDVTDTPTTEHPQDPVRDPGSV